MGFWNRRQEMGWAALIMGASILTSRFMGLFRDKAISFLFGATKESDLYFAAFVIPDFINYLLAGGYFSITLIPLLAVYFERSEEDGWKFFSAVFTWIGMVIVLLTAGCMFYAPQLALLAAPGLDVEAQARLAFFLRIIMPAQVCFLLGSCLTAILYLRKQFLIPALTPLIYNFFIILGGVFLRSRGMEGFCWGVLAGSILGNLLLPYMAVRQGGSLNLHPTFRHPGLKTFCFLALPLMLGQSIVVLDEQFLRIFGSLVGAGAISWLNYARRIMLVPVGVVAQAAGVATYPFLADLVARKESARFNRALHDALQSVSTLLIPLSIWMMVVSEPTIRLIFQQGHFGPSDTQQTARVLQVFLLVVSCWGFQQILGRAFYARQDTLTPVVVGTITTVASIPIFYVFSTHWRAMGVAAASAISIALYTVALSLWWRHRFGKELFSGLGTDLLKLTVLSIMSSGPAIWIVQSSRIDWGSHIYLEALSSILASGLCFAVLFSLLSCSFIPSLVRPLFQRLGPIGRRFVR
jgi:putative peptidoglycan lipid II flippase